MNLATRIALWYDVLLGVSWMPSARLPLWKKPQGVRAFAQYKARIRAHFRHHLFFDLIQITATLLAFWWWYSLPVPGYAIGLLALLAAVMSVQSDTRNWQTFSWILLFGAFLIIEFRAIDLDRGEAALADAQRRTAENSQFLTIIRGLLESNQQSQNQFQETMSRLDATLNRVGDSIKTQTGGDSFAYLTFTPQSDQRFTVAIASRGKYPLREIRITMVDEERRLQAMQEYNKHPDGNWLTTIQAADTYFEVPYLRPQSPEGPSGDVEILGAYSFGAKDSNDLTIAFSSLNGFWNERLHLRKINGKWHQSLSVLGPTSKQALQPFIYSDSDYPEGKALAEKDWARVNTKKER